MTVFRVAAAAMGLAALAACEVPSSPDATGGEATLAAGNAAGLFQQVCIVNQAMLSEAPKTMVNLPFTRNSTEDVYYHNELDLSFKLTPQGGGVICSMVWTSDSNTGVNRATIMSIAPDALFRETDGQMSAAIIGVP